MHLSYTKLQVLVLVDTYVLHAFISVPGWQFEGWIKRECLIIKSNTKQSTIPTSNCDQHSTDHVMEYQAHKTKTMSSQIITQPWPAVYVIKNSYNYNIQCVAVITRSMFFQILTDDTHISAVRVSMRCPLWVQPLVEFCSGRCSVLYSEMVYWTAL